MKKLLVLALVVLVAFLFLSTCQFPGSNKPAGSSGLGVLMLRLSAGGCLTSRNITPPADEVYVTRFEVSGENATNGALTFGPVPVDQNLAPVVQLDLELGDWNIEVDGYNDANDLIGQGAATVTIEEDKQKEITITVMPVYGTSTTGRLNITIEWPEDKDQLTSAVVAAPDFVPTPTGIDTPQFAEMTDPAPRNKYVGYVYNEPSFPSGSYQVTLTIEDGEGNTLWGTVEGVWIMDGMDSAASYVLGKDVLQVNVTPNVPIDIKFYEDSVALANDITGKDQRIGGGESLTVVPVPNPADTGTYSYQWYLDGHAIGAGDPATIGGDGFTITITLPATGYDVGMHNFDLVITNNAGGMTSYSSGRVVVEFK
jgi:hypothetical protein